MKKLLIILFIMLPVLAYAESSLRFESELHDFGNVKQGDFLEFTFEYANTGTDDLLIKRLTPS